MLQNQTAEYRRDEPARFPSIFIVAATVAVYGPPISTQAFQEMGIVRSLQKLASPMHIIAGSTAPIRVKANNRRAVPRKPQNAIERRGRRKGTNPLIRDPKPPNKRGSTDRAAAWPCDCPLAS